MNEARYELKHWKSWKRIVQLLESTKEELKDMKKAINLNTKEMPGGNHTTINEKFNKIIEDCEKYDEVIKEYNFFINRLEKAIATLLNEEQREVCIIYANYPNNSNKREFEAIKKGYARSTYYDILKESIDILNSILEPIERSGLFSD